MTHAEFDKEARKDRNFYIGVAVFVAVWLAYCVYDGHSKNVAAAECKAKGGSYINVGFEKYGCYQLKEIR